MVFLVRLLERILLNFFSIISLSKVGKVLSLVLLESVSSPLNFVDDNCLFYHQWNLFGIRLLETIRLRKITILLIEPKTVCKHLPSALSIWITEKLLRIKKVTSSQKRFILKPDKDNASQYSGFIKACNKFVSPNKQINKSLQFYEISNSTFG